MRVEITRKSVSEVLCFSDVDYITIGTQHFINAGLRWYGAKIWFEGVFRQRFMTLLLQRPQWPLFQRLQPLLQP